MQKLVRLSIAIGGFLMVSGLILTGAIFLVLLGIIDVTVFTNQATEALLAMLFLAIGIADLTAGLILLLRR
ncbi:MAG: hypothetical protein QXP44_05620 [Candidatus Bathyarchaeia archaeon]